MWEVQKPLLRRFMPRYLLLWLISLFMAIIGHTLLSPQKAYALDATWTSDSDDQIITYDGHTYKKQSDAKKINFLGVPEGTKVYRYLEDKDTQNTKAHFIFFPSGTTPINEKVATYVVYKHAPPNTYTKETDPIGVNVTTKAKGNTSCDGRFTFGIGWIICPITNFLSHAMDWMFEQLAYFLVVQPAQTSTDNPLYTSWKMMQSIANVAFVIAFMLIIYSMISGGGLNNYTIKKILPRLIAAAVLVNISYWICALAVDVSNTIGYSIHNLFVMMRNQIVGSDINSWQVVSWSSITGAILSGGAATAGLGVAGYAFLASAGGAIFQLLPTIVAVLIAVLIALLVLVARHALIVILIIVSPLAFVAFLLPNTEKWFEKWRSAFLTLLLMFPIFSVIFGGSQLAGIAIIKNATSINMLLLGMAVQVAPVIITPLLVKFSGNTIGRIAGMANNPKRGLLDRTKNWANERSENYKSKVLAGKSSAQVPVIANLAQKIDSNKRKRERMKSYYDTVAATRFSDSTTGRNLDFMDNDANDDKRLVEARTERDYNNMRNKSTYMLIRDMETRTIGDESNSYKSRSDLHYQNLKAGVTPDGLEINNPHSSDSPYSSILNRAVRTSNEASLNASAQRIAENTMKDNYAELLDKGGEYTLTDGAKIDLRSYTGGVKGAEGGVTALANAAATMRSQFGSSVNDYKELIKHHQPETPSIRDFILKGDNFTVSKEGKEPFTYDVSNEYAREAAVEHYMSISTVGDLEKIVIQSGKGQRLNGHTSTIVSSLLSSGARSKAPYLHGSILDDIAHGRIASDQDLTNYVHTQITQGKFSPEQFATIDPAALKRYLKAVSQRPTTLSEADHQIYEHQQLPSIIAKAQATINDPQIVAKISAASYEVLEQIANFNPDSRA